MPKFRQNAEASALGLRGNLPSLQKFPSGARFATPARHANQAEHIQGQSVPMKATTEQNKELVLEA